LALVYGYITRRIARTVKFTGFEGEREILGRRSKRTVRKA